MQPTLNEIAETQRKNIVRDAVVGVLVICGTALAYVPAVTPFLMK
jgi:hypothetical protein